MNEIINTIDYKGYHIEVLREEDPFSPRRWEHLGQMVYAHNLYVLGDAKLQRDQGSLENAFAFYIALNEMGIPDKYFTDYRMDSLTEKGYDAVWKWIEKNVVYLKLYLYDHTGITIRTVPFPSVWDSGMVGYIYATKERIKEVFKVKRVSSKLLKEVDKMLEKEVREFDSYLRGEVYCIDVKKDGELFDSVCGIYDDLDDKDAIIKATEAYLNLD